MGDDKESQKPVLPKDIFRSERTFDIHEISALRLPWVVSSLSLGLGCLAAKTNFIVRTFSLSWGFAVLLFEIAFMFPSFYLQYVRGGLDITLLVQQVLELKPGIDVQRWDEVAHRVNLTFYQKRLWNTPYSFFSGTHARSFFSGWVLRSYFSGRFDDINDADKIQSSCDYLQSLNEQFEMSLKDDLPQLSLSAQLPRDTQKSFFFFFRSLSKTNIFFLCYLQGLAFYMLLGAFVESRFIFAFYFLLQCLTWVVCCIPMRSIYPKLGIMQAINFLAIITNVNPREELDNWDQIAMLMNRYLIGKDGGYSKNIFFDGKHCLNFYKNCLVRFSLNPNLGSLDANMDHFVDLKQIVETVQSKIE